MSFIDVMRKIGADWRGLNENDKEVYTERQKADKSRFEEESESFTRTTRAGLPHI